jgi:hypothetical protein
MPNLAILKVYRPVDHAHLTHTIHTIIFQTIGKSNRDQRTLSIRCDLDNLTGVTLAVILFAVKIVSNLNRSNLTHFHLSSLTSHGRLCHRQATCSTDVSILSAGLIEGNTEIKRIWKLFCREVSRLLRICPKKPTFFDANDKNEILRIACGICENPR